MKKRVLWLVSNQYITDSDVPKLLKEGCEVLTRGNYCGSPISLCAGITRDYDSSVSLDETSRKALLETDFCKKPDKETRKLIAENFDIVIFDEVENALEWLTYTFPGIIVLRADGLPDGKNYTQIILKRYGVWMLDLIRDLEGRFCFLHTMPDMQKAESPIIKNRAIYLPVSIPDYEPHWSVSNSNSCLFDFPNMLIDTAVQKEYEAMRDAMRAQRFDFHISGPQILQAKIDNRILDDRTKSKRALCRNSASALFYGHAENGRFPFAAWEAIAAGMPVVYLKDNAVDVLMGKDNLPGCCRDLEQAVKLLRKLCRGDVKLSNRIRASQKTYYEALEKTTGQQWNKFISLVGESLRKPQASGGKSTKIGVIVPAEYTGGVLDYAIRVLKCLSWGARGAGDEVELVLGIIDHKVYEEEPYHLDPVRNMGIPIRKFKWEEMVEDSTKRLGVYRMLDEAMLRTDNYFILNDHACNFEDCDLLLFMSDRIPGRLLSLTPYIVVAHDFIQRYINFGNDTDNQYLRNERNARMVFTTSQPTYIDAMQYGGISPDRLKLTPLLFDLVKKPAGISAQEEEKYFLWSTNRSIHKNHIIAMDAISEYYQEGGNLKCFITGANTTNLNPSRDLPENYPAPLLNHLKTARSRIEKDANLRKNLIFCGNMPKKKYLSVLEGAQFFFHPGYADNGNGTCFDAASLGVPTISSDYPVMRYIDERCKLNMRFFQPFDYKDMARCLLWAQHNVQELRTGLPTKDVLLAYSIEGTHTEYYDIVRDIAYIGGK